MLPFVVSLLILSCAAAATLAVLLHRRGAAAQRQAEKRRCDDASTDGLIAVIASIDADAKAAILGEKFCEFMLDIIGGDGALVYARRETEEDLVVLARCGVCSDWFPDNAAALEPLAVEESVSYDFFWSRRALIYDRGTIRKWLPTQYSGGIHSALVAPVRTDQGDGYMAVFRTGGTHPFQQPDQVTLTRYTRLAELGFRRLSDERRRRTLEQALHRAHEEGMLQISTGIIHNIGNAITVIQLAVERLKTDEFASCGELLGFLQGEVIPELRSHATDGTIGEFLQHDPQGAEYLAAISDLLEKIAESLKQHGGGLDFISEKFKTVTEIINLQQQFIGELGTENVVVISAVLEDVERMCLEPMEQRGIAFEKSVGTSGQVLVDPAMLRHMLLLLIKYSIESVTASQKMKPRIRLSVTRRAQEEKSFIHIEVTDNGAGHAVNYRDDTPGADQLKLDSRTRDFIFCRRRVQKYGGVFDVKSDYARGSRIIIELPEYTPDQPTDEPPAGEAAAATC